MNNYSKYKNYNDYELLYLINEGSELAFNVFFEKYEIYITKIVSQFVYYNNENFEDLVQEGRITLYQCIKSYNQNNNASFFSYFTVIYRRKIIRLLNSAYYNNHVVLDENIITYHCDKESKKITGDMYFTDPLKIDFFNECIIGQMSLTTYARKNKLSYDKVYYLNKKVIEELKEILGIK